LEKGLLEFGVDDPSGVDEGEDDAGLDDSARLVRDSTLGEVQAAGMVHIVGAPADRSS